MTMGDPLSGLRGQLVTLWESEELFARQVEFQREAVSFDRQSAQIGLVRHGVRPDRLPREDVGGGRVIVGSCRGAPSGHGAAHRRTRERRGLVQLHDVPSGVPSFSLALWPTIPA